MTRRRLTIAVALLAAWWPGCTDEARQAEDGGRVYVVPDAHTNDPLELDVRPDGQIADSGGSDAADSEVQPEDSGPGDAAVGEDTSGVDSAIDSGGPSDGGPRGDPRSDVEVEGADGEDRPDGGLDTGSPDAAAAEDTRLDGPDGALVDSVAEEPPAIDSGMDSAVDVGTPLDGLFTELVEEVVIEVDYQTGAAPYTGSLLGFGDVWDLFLTNAEAAFAEAPRPIVVPTELSGMEELADIEGTDFTAADILAITDLHRQTASSETSRTFYALWLDGYFFDSTGRRETVLGVSIGRTEVIAMFKPVIRSTSFPEQVEQATLVHEFGHAIGLVNNGLAMVTPHQDEDHGRHCTNADCVMFWTVAGPDIVEYVLSAVLTSDSVLWGEECLADFEAAAR